jgi:catechol 2,3-dioxygenase
MGAVHLTVADLARSLAYYESEIGLRVHWREDGRVALGAGDEDLLVLIEEPGARPADRYCGLYHFALLLPDRGDLARWLGHAAAERVPLTGMSDHFVSEAIYLRDPDHHGIEIYADRPRRIWEGRVAETMTTAPLDVHDLMRAAGDAGFDGLPRGTVMGHVHLRVHEVAATNEFYADTLGFDVMAAFGTQATFLSAGGYHHHLGANTWESRGRPPAPPDTARLARATIVFPDTESRDRAAASFDTEPLDDGALGVHDPSGNLVALATAT